MSAKPKPWNERLDPLDVVYCRFPEEGRLDPAPKPRPALVLNVNDRTEPQRVEVAFGTSRRTDDKYAGEFELSRKDGAVFKKTGLTERTKFDLGRTAWLPYDERWFTPRPSVPHIRSFRHAWAMLAPALRLARRSRRCPAYVAALLSARTASVRAPGSTDPY